MHPCANSQFPSPTLEAFFQLGVSIWGPDMCQLWALFLSYFLPFSPPTPLTSACRSLEAGAELLFSMAGLMLGSGT